MKNIDFNFIDIDLEISEKNYKEWIIKCIESSGKSVGEIAYVFCNDEYLLKMNKDYLNHDYYTDIITFDYCEDNIISGDLFISYDRIKENSNTHKTKLTNELDRVIIHGIIHLLGQKDKTKEEAKQMRMKEDYYLSLR
jgi:probable rRNA maturation factor